MESKENKLNVFKARIARLWNDHYVFSLRNDSHFKDHVNTRLKGNEMLTLFITFLLLMLGLAYLLFRFTGLNNFVSSERANQRNDLIAIQMRADSLEQRLRLNTLFYSQIQEVLIGDADLDSIPESLDSAAIGDVTFAELSAEELALRERVSELDQFELRQVTNSSNAKMVTPADGIISDPFSKIENHFGIDIAAPKGSPVLAAAAGTVILSTWSSETGNTMALAHKNGLVSFYKHNEKLLKESGEVVEAGEAIALVGNSGEESSGYHLHFELWKEGLALDPKEYLDLE